MSDPAASIPDPQETSRRKFEQSLAWEPFIEDLAVSYEPNPAARRVVHLFSKFTAEKLALVQSTGFECCLRLPYHFSSDDAFYVSMLKKIDPYASCLRVGYSIYDLSSTQLVYRDEDVNYVLGLPFVGSEVESNGEVSLEHVSTVKKILFMGAPRHSLSIQYIESILTREYGFPMTEAEQNAFKVAVVIYTMVNFLAVQGGTKRIPFEIFGSLVHPSRIRHVNWCGHVRRTLLAEAAKVQELVKRGVNIIQPGGCDLFAKVHYLDNLRHEELKINDRVFPRALVFIQDVMDLAIRLDSIKQPDGARKFGQCAWKREAVVCYSKRSLPAGYEEDLSTSSSSSKKRKRDDPIQLLEHGRRKITMAMVLLEANKESALSRKSKEYDFDYLRNKKRLRLSHLASKTHQRNDFEGFVNSDCMLAQTASPEAISPFEMIFKHEDAPYLKWHKFFDLLKKGEVIRLEDDWFIHREAYLIKIVGWELRAALIPGGYFTITVGDGAIMLYIARDNAMYPLKSKRWRHFIPPSWAYTVMYGAFGLDMLCQMKYFVGPHIFYELQHCRMLTAPVNCDGSWSCYFWDLQKKQIIVLDPQMQMGSRQDIRDRHSSLVKLLHKRLFNVINTLFPEWDISKHKWGRVYRNDVSVRCRWGESGLYTVHYAAHFDGEKLVEKINEAFQDNCRAQLLWMMLAMKGNSGIVPSEFGLLKYC